MSIQREITYSIGETEKLPGASQKQIRYWENKGDIPEAARNECGDIGTAERIICGERTYRHFAKEQVDQIKTIKSFLDKGYKLSHASPRYRDFFAFMFMTGLRMGEAAALKWKDVKLASIKPIVNHYYNWIQRDEDGKNLEEVLNSAQVLTDLDGG